MWARLAGVEGAVNEPVNEAAPPETGAGGGGGVSPLLLHSSLVSQRAMINRTDQPQFNKQSAFTDYQTSQESTLRPHIDELAKRGTAGEEWLLSDVVMKSDSMGAVCPTLRSVVHIGA